MSSCKYTVKQITEFIRKNLDGYYPEKEIQQFIYILFEYELGFSKVELVTRSEVEIDEETQRKFLDYLNQLKTYKPIQYITGETSFYGLNFHVNSDVLIPRPETEELVDWILKQKLSCNPIILDVGTGSGCIAVALAKNLSGSIVHAVDISENALGLANENAILNKVNVNLSQENILSPSEEFKKREFDLIVSNPPYIALRDKANMNKNVLDYEPHLSLFVPDEDPLVFYKAIMTYAMGSLKENGLLFFEINESFDKEIVALMKNHKFAEIELRKDINDKFRMVRGRKSATVI
jgi:release factor glutamine methyltransferase